MIAVPCGVFMWQTFGETGERLHEAYARVRLWFGPRGACPPPSPPRGKTLTPTSPKHDPGMIRFQRQDHVGGTL